MKVSIALIPLHPTCSGYVGFHLMRYVEHAINYDLSQCKTYDTGAVLARKPVFYRDKVAGIDLFTIPEEATGIFVSETFRQAVIANRFKGFYFTKEMPLYPPIAQ